MKEFLEIAHRAFIVADVARGYSREEATAAQIKSRADSLLTDLVKANDRCDGVATDLDIPRIARAIGAFLHIVVAYADLELGPTSNAWALALSAQQRVLAAEIEQLEQFIERKPQ